MRCELWKTKAFPYVEGILADDEHGEYAVHLEDCELCRAEVADSRVVCRTLHDLPTPTLGRADAAAFDAAIMSSLRPMIDELAVTGGEREHAARLITVVTRGLGHRRFEPLFAPIKSLIALSLVLIAGAIGAAVLFGDTIVRGVSGGVNMTAQAVWLRTHWLAQEVVGSLVDLLTVANVTRGMFSHARPWLDAWNLFLMSHGQEIMIGLGVTSVLVAAAIWKVRRERRRDRSAVRSS